VEFCMNADITQMLELTLRCSAPAPTATKRKRVNSEPNYLEHEEFQQKSDSDSDIRKPPAWPALRQSSTSSNSRVGCGSLGASNGSSSTKSTHGPQKTCGGSPGSNLEERSSR
jgi:hypothetical protein